MIPERLKGQAGFLIHKAGQRGLEVCNGSLERLGIDVRHYGVLCTLMEEACSQVGLSETLAVDRTTMVQLLDDLEGAGMVARCVNPVDRRAHVVTVTARGKRMVEKARALTEEGDGQFLRALDAGERAELKRLLMKLLEEAAK